MKIGIFWYWNHQVIGIAHTFEYEQADSIGLIDSPYTHVEYWTTLQEQYPELQNYEYEQIPRGRIIFDKNKSKAIMYLDKSLLYKSKVKRLYSFFDLDEKKIILRKDPHYRIL